MQALRKLGERLCRGGAVDGDEKALLSQVVKNLATLLDGMGRSQDALHFAVAASDLSPTSSVLAGSAAMLALKTEQCAARPPRSRFARPGP